MLRMVDMLQKFRGTLLGALAGDCFGAFYEGMTKPEIQPHVVERMQSILNYEGNGELKYTDDSAMSISLCKSLIDQKTCNPENIGRIFTEDFFLDPNRGYGQNIGAVFKEIRAHNYEHIFTPAVHQFNGSGSYGNGGAMRIAPMALFGYHMPDEEFEADVRNVTELTHTNPMGVQGALVQALAVRWILRSSNTLDTSALIAHLHEAVCRAQGMGGPRRRTTRSTTNEFAEQLSVVEELLNRGPRVSTEEVVARLGHDISAHRSVPTALYIFLRSQQPMEGIPFQDTFTRCLTAAVSLGGDTDTIAAMACAMAGAQVGEAGIPEPLLARCEAAQTVRGYANQLFHMVDSMERR